jgi:hypothetical protein
MCSFSGGLLIFEYFLKDFMSFLVVYFWQKINFFCLIL